MRVAAAAWCKRETNRIPQSRADRAWRAAARHPPSGVSGAAHERISIPVLWQRERTLMTMPIDGIPEAITAVAALGTASYGLVDASKVVRGGVSNRGLGVVRNALAPFGAAFGAEWRAIAQATIRSNWLNGIALADQKAAAKALIRLGLSATSAAAAAKITNVDSDALTSAVGNAAKGQSLSGDELNLLARFDAYVSAILDAAYELADQQYRNAAKSASSVVSVVLAGGAACMFDPTSYGVLVAMIVGLAATPLAPVAKDLASALNTATNALKKVRS